MGGTWLSFLALPSSPNKTSYHPHPWRSSPASAGAANDNKFVIYDAHSMPWRGLVPDTEFLKCAVTTGVRSPMVTFTKCPNARWTEPAQATACPCWSAPSSALCPVYVCMRMCTSVCGTCIHVHVQRLEETPNQELAIVQLGQWRTSPSILPVSPTQDWVPCT